MRRRTAVAITMLLTLVSAPAVDAATPRDADRLDAYGARVTSQEMRVVREHGLDVIPRDIGPRIRVDVVLTPQRRAELERRGIATALKRVEGGGTLREHAAAQAAGGFTVWRSWDEAGGIRDQMRAIAQANPRVAELVTLGTSIRGREILALRITRRPRARPDGALPSALFLSTQHAREWISTEVNRRLLGWYVDRWKAGDDDVRELLDETELWFVLVANPDGYEHTFDTERLWRKNLRDNDGDGRITDADGVDPDRNFPSRWKYDEEGSSSLPSSATYRGTSPASEPETRALKALLDRVGFEFVVNWHSAGRLLLYGEGWQSGTPTADDPIYHALAGNLDRPAIPEFHPGLGSDVLHVTNGDTIGYAHARTGALGFVAELSEGCDGCGFVFPDDEALVQAEFERVLPFARSVADSAHHPTRPDSPLGIGTRAFYLESDDPYKEGLPDANFVFKHSYGDPQPVQVLARRGLGPVRLHYRIDGGPVQTATMSAWDGGERYSPPGTHYRRLRGRVTGTSPGDSVEVWFATRRGPRSESFTYEAVAESGNRVLVVTAEDYTGSAPDQPPGPHYLRYYLDALKANGIDADVYDVDARGRVAADHMGVLGHYDAVVWYTGEDLITRRAGRPAGDADRLAMDEMLQFRSYMNEGGKVLYTGLAPGGQYSLSFGPQFYDPRNEGPCPDEAFDPRRCLGLFGSPASDLVNDVLQYWFGAHQPVLNDGHDAEVGRHWDAIGVDQPLGSLRWAFGGLGSADNQSQSASYVSTSGILPSDEFPRFHSWISSRWDKPGGPHEPHSGERFLYSQAADVAYKRLTREIVVPASGEHPLTFWTSFSTDPARDHIIVEARTAGGDDWTTLPDANGHTARDPGAGCLAARRVLHPHLDHYRTLDADNACAPTGTTGEWHSASGNSAGWQEWRLDLSRWAGRTVEISIAYVTDVAVRLPGVLIDDVTLPDGTTTSFEHDLGGWTVSGPPEGSAANTSDWKPSTAAAFPVGASISTEDSLILGFGIEGVAGAGTRAALMGRAMRFLLP